MIAAPNARACAANWPKYAGVACGNTMRCPDMLARPTFGSTASGLPASRMSAIAPSAAAGPAPWFAPNAATSSVPSRAAAVRADTPASVCRSLSKRHERDDRQRRDRADRRDRGLEIDEVVERLDHEEIDAAALEDLRLLGVERRRLVALELRVAERADRARDEDVAPRHLARLARELHGGTVQPLELVLEEVLRELRPVRAERVRLDQLGASADVAEVHVDDALGRPQVRLLGAAKARHRACEHGAHAAVRHDRRSRLEPLEEPAHLERV